MFDYSVVPISHAYCFVLFSNNTIAKIVLFLFLESYKISRYLSHLRKSSEHIKSQGGLIIKQLFETIFSQLFLEKKICQLMFL